MIHGTRLPSRLKPARGALEVRFRSRGSHEAFRPGLMLGGGEALESARNLAQECASTYGKLEFAVFKDGKLVQKVQRTRTAVVPSNFPSAA